MATLESLCRKYGRTESELVALRDRARKLLENGVSFLDPEDVTDYQARSALSLRGAEKFVSSQPQYSMLWRRPEREVIPFCERHGISQIVWSPLAQGVLTGKYGTGQEAPAGTRATGDGSEFMRDLLQDEVLAAVQRLRPIASANGLSMAQLALAWVLRQDNVAAAITGASRPAQVLDNAGAAGVTLSDETLRQIDGALEGAVLS